MTAEIAVNRFGLGAKPGELARAASNPQRYLLKQIRPLSFDNTHSSLDIAQQLQSQRQNNASNESRQQYAQDMYRSMSVDVLTQAIHSDTSFMWRMFDFFSNHFSVSAQGPVMTAMVGTLEREAIAPHLTGYFSDMLLSVCQHPVMIRYLNNENSFGENSRLGKRGKGLNENLAREVLELHTLGVDGGYSQQDVIALAKGISGWSIANPSKAKSRLFLFKSAGHEPGAQTLLQKQYPQSGVAQGSAMLKDLSMHPATARHVCHKLATHIVSDTPSEQLVQAMTERWMASAGNLPSVYETLIKHVDAWHASAQKFKTPREYFISVTRGLGVKKLRKGWTIRSLRDLGQPPFRAGSPAGYEGTEAFWNNGFGLMARISWLQQLIDNTSQNITELAILLLGEHLSETTYHMVKRAESRERAFMLLFASPDFLRR